MIPDQRSRIAQYRIHRLIGKLFLVLALFIALPMTVAMTSENSSHGFLLIVPLALIVGLLWGSFPAFCRCPGCRKKMKTSRKDSKHLSADRFFQERHSTYRAYLVCDHCQYYALLGEYRNGGGA